MRSPYKIEETADQWQQADSAQSIQLPSQMIHLEAHEVFPTIQIFASLFWYPCHMIQLTRTLTAQIILPNP
jgi:hypothetical protein